MPPVQIEILPDPQSMAQAAAAWIVRRIAATTEVFRMALSGGNTPRLLYDELASPQHRERIEWRRLELFWGDERFVPHDDPRSNYRMARETLLAHAPVLIDHIHPILAEGDPEVAAQRYEALLKGLHGTELSPTEPPLFQLVLLGLGEDGHTASLFPGSPALEERVHWVLPVSGRDVPRITLTYPAIDSSGAAMFLVSGEDKAAMVRRVHENGCNLPAARVRSQGEVVWFLDRAAASRLPAKGAG